MYEQHAHLRTAVHVSCREIETILLHEMGPQYRPAGLPRMQGNTTLNIVGN